MSKKNNIYLIAQYVVLPKNPKQTAQSGYMSDPNNLRYDERVFVARGYRDRYLQNDVVLDLTEEKIIKNSFRTEKNFEDIFAHFYEGFGNYIDDCVKKLNENIQIK